MQTILTTLLLQLPSIFAAFPEYDEPLPQAKFSGTPIESGQYPFLVLVTAFYKPSAYSDYYQDPEIENDQNYDYKEKTANSDNSEYKFDSNYSSKLILTYKIFFEMSHFLTFLINFSVSLRVRPSLQRLPRFKTDRRWKYDNF